MICKGHPVVGCPFAFHNGNGGSGRGKSALPRWLCQTPPLAPPQGIGEGKILRRHTMVSVWYPYRLVVRMWYHPQYCLRVVRRGLTPVASVGVACSWLVALAGYASRTSPCILYSIKIVTEYINDCIKFYFYRQ